MNFLTKKNLKSQLSKQDYSVGKYVCGGGARVRVGVTASILPLSFFCLLGHCCNSIAARRWTSRASKHRQRSGAVTEGKKTARTSHTKSSLLDDSQLNIETIAEIDLMWHLDRLYDDVLYPYIDGSLYKYIYIYFFSHLFKRTVNLNQNGRMKFGFTINYYSNIFRSIAIATGINRYVLLLSNTW